MPANALKPWQFQPGPDPRRTGRTIGSKNRQQLTPMRKLVRDAMARAGNDVHKEGVLGFLTRVANAHPLEFFQEAAKVEPKLVFAELDENFNGASSR